MSRHSRKSLRLQIDIIKNNVRWSDAPFDGDNHPFKKALSELRKEGLPIIHDRQNCRYYNLLTINKMWLNAKP